MPKLKAKYKDIFWASLCIEKGLGTPHEQFLVDSYLFVNAMRRVFFTMSPKEAKSSETLFNANFPSIRKVLDLYTHKISITHYSPALLQSLEQFRNRLFERLGFLTANPASFYQTYFLVFIYKNIISTPCIHPKKEKDFIQLVKEIDFKREATTEITEAIKKIDSKNEDHSQFIEIARGLHFVKLLNCLNFAPLLNKNKAEFVKLQLPGIELFGYFLDNTESLEFDKKPIALSTIPVMASILKSVEAGNSSLHPFFREDYPLDAKFLFTLWGIRIGTQ